MSTRPPWPARWGIVDRPTVSRHDALLANNDGNEVAAAQVLPRVGVSMAFEVPEDGATITTVGWKLGDGGATVDGTLVARVYKNDGTLATPVVGRLLRSSTTEVDGSSLAATRAWFDFEFDPFTLIEGQYVASIERVSATTGDLIVGRSSSTTYVGTSNNEDPDGTWSAAQANQYVFRVAAKTGSREGELLRKNEDEDHLAIINEEDPTNIFAISAEGAAGGLEAGFVMVYELEANDWYGMMGTRDPVEGDIDTAYGIKQDSNGNWIVDLTETTNTRVTVEDVDLNQNYYLVSFLTAHIQS